MCLIVLTQTINVLSQNSFEISLVYVPAKSKLSNDRFINTFYHSSGIRLTNTFKNRFAIRAGAYFRKYGTTFELPQAINTTGPYNASYIVKSIDIPILIGYYLNSNKIRFGPFVGITNSFLISQEGLRLGLIRPIGVYEDYALNAMVVLDLTININKFLNINISPFWHYQLNDNIGPYKQRIVGTDLGIGFYF